MANEKFTKGPWCVNKDTSGDYFVSAESGGWICDVGSECDRESFFDASIIAVAPELYDFVNKMALALASDYPSLRDLALEVLAKARGEL